MLAVAGAGLMLVQALIAFAVGGASVVVPSGGVRLCSVCRWVRSSPVGRFGWPGWVSIPWRV